MVYFNSFADDNFYSTYCKIALEDKEWKKGVQQLGVLGRLSIVLQEDIKNVDFIMKKCP